MWGKVFSYDGNAYQQWKNLVVQLFGIFCSPSSTVISNLLFLFVLQRKLHLHVSFHGKLFDRALKVTL